MKIEFLLSTGQELNNKYLYSFVHKEKVDLFVCLFRSKMRANKCFFNPFSQLVSLCLDSDKEILPLCD